MKQLFYLIRHGEKHPIKFDPGLTEVGQKQALVLAEYLNNLSIDQIWASPALRTRQTAQYLAKLKNLDINIEPLLKERANWGDKADQDIDDFIEMWKRASQNRDKKPLVGDSSRQAGQRVEKVLEQIKLVPGKVFVLFTHGGTIADFVRNIFPDEILEQYYPGFSRDYEWNVKETSITMVEKNWQSGQWKLKMLAQTPHL
jgi:broad specificity phosphatase PhoE